MTSPRSRVAPGVPAGGQFTTESRDRSGVSLDSELAAAIQRGMDLGARDPAGFKRADLPEGMVTVNDAVDRLVAEGVDRQAALDAVDSRRADIFAQDGDGRIVPVIPDFGLDELSTRLGQARWGHTGIRVGSRSPWGVADSVQQVAPGIAVLSTPGHGGIKLSAERNAAMPAYLREPGGWYEEDCEWARVAIVFPAVPHFAAIQQRMSDPDNSHHDKTALTEGITHAERVVRDYEPDAYEQFTGRAISPGQSIRRDDETFAAEHADSHLTISAELAGDGMVKVTTKVGGHSSGEHAERRTYLVPGGEYSTGNRSPHPFVVDPARHQRIGDDGERLNDDGSPAIRTGPRQVTAQTAGAVDAGALRKQAREMAGEAAERGDTATAAYYQSLAGDS